MLAMPESALISRLPEKPRRVELLVSCLTLFWSSCLWLWPVEQAGCAWIEVSGCFTAISLARAPVECVAGAGDSTLLLLGVVGVVAVRLMATGYSGRGRLTVCSVNLAKLAGAARGVGRTLQGER